MWIIFTYINDQATFKKHNAQKESSQSLLGPSAQNSHFQRGDEISLEWLYKTYFQLQTFVFGVREFLTQRVKIQT